MALTAKMEADARLRTSRNIARVSRETADTSQELVPQRGEMYLKCHCLMIGLPMFYNFRCEKQGKVPGKPYKFLTYYECQCPEGYSGNFVMS